MSRYLVTTVVLLLLLTGCSLKSTTPKSPQKSIHKEAKYTTFELENEYIIHALYYKEHREYAKAYRLFKELYEKSSNPEYLLEAARLSIVLKNYTEAVKELKRLTLTDPKNLELYRLLTIAYLKLGKKDDALNAANRALKLDPDNIRNVDVTASIYLAYGENEKAYQAYENYYNIHHDEESLIRMASILYYKMKDRDNTVKLLETHSKMVGCSEKVCLFLAEIYREKNDLDNLASVYERLYEETGKSEYAQKAAEIYTYEKRYKKAVKILESSGADERLLLAVLKQSKEFKKALKLAKKLYDETLDPIWEAEYGVLLYESSDKKSDPALLKKVEKILKNAIGKGVDEALYLNYLGYLLIDHDIDVKEGMRLVEKALEKVPDSPFYLDSLAWGYYRLGECTKAYEVMKKVVDKMGLDDLEIKGHWEKINNCRSKKK